MTQSPATHNEDFNRLREHIRPKASELEFEGPQWGTTFRAAVDEAVRRRMPILFWAMNGHPLACT
jgi:hypothetical protein